MRVRIILGMTGLILAGSMLSGAQGIAKGAPLTEGNLRVGEAQAASVPVVDESNGVIPGDAVRLRIIANSDSPEDQALKRKVRDKIIQDVGVRLRGVTEHDQAKEFLQAELPEINKTTIQVLKQEGSSYKVQTDYGMVPFPTKLYGDNVYPAGNYEALRIIIGEGQGQNWWCVLFPPLCFVDLANGDAVQAKDMAVSKPLATIQVPTGDTKTAETVQVRLGISDGLHSLLTKISSFFHSLFA